MLDANVCLHWVASHNLLQQHIKYTRLVSGRSSVGSLNSTNCTANKPFFRLRLLQVLEAKEMKNVSKDRVFLVF